MWRGFPADKIPRSRNFICKIFPEPNAIMNFYDANDISDPKWILARCRNRDSIQKSFSGIIRVIVRYKESRHSCGMNPSQCRREARRQWPHCSTRVFHQGEFAPPHFYIFINFRWDQYFIFAPRTAVNGVFLQVRTAPHGLFIRMWPSWDSPLVPFDTFFTRIMLSRSALEFELL